MKRFSLAVLLPLCSAAGDRAGAGPFALASARSRAVARRRP